MAFSNAEAEFLNAFRAANLNAQDLHEHIYESHTQQGPFNTYDPFRNQKKPSSLADLVDRVHKIIYEDDPPVNKETRVKQINEELDILRGRVPTPPNYKVDPLRAKALMKELKQLS
jgi:hypothetical protein